MNARAIEATDVSRRFRSGKSSVLALDSVSFAVEAGYTLAVVGESGSGKTTAARLVLGLDTPDSGSIRILGKDVASLSSKQLRELRREIQVVQQDPFSQLNRRHTVRRIIAGPLIAFRLGTKESREKKVLELLEAVGLDSEHLHRRPHELSGGQCQRVAIARALALDPSILILDEAVSALDVSVRAQVLNLLKRLQVERGLTYLFITHDLGVAHYMADEIVVMFRGRIVEGGTRDEVFKGYRHHYTAGLLASVPVVDFASKKLKNPIPLQGQIDSHDACPYRSRCAVGRTLDLCGSEVPAESRFGKTHKWRCHFPISQEQVSQ